MSKNITISILIILLLALGAYTLEHNRKEVAAVIPVQTQTPATVTQETEKPFTFDTTTTGTYTGYVTLSGFYYSGGGENGGNYVSFTVMGDDVKKLPPEAQQNTGGVILLSDGPIPELDSEKCYQGKATIILSAISTDHKDDWRGTLAKVVSFTPDASLCK